MRFSPSKMCFYPSDLDYSSLPDDLVDVPDDEYAAAMNKGPGQVLTFANGHVLIEALPPLTAEELQTALAFKISAAIQDYIDNPARAWGYDDAKSAISYVGDDYPRFNDEGLAIRAFRSACWRMADQVRSEVIAGDRLAPSVAELLALLPPPPSRPSAQ